MKIAIVVDVDPQWIDEKDNMGITEDAYMRLSGYTEEWGAAPLGWLGEVESVNQVELP